MPDPAELEPVAPPKREPLPSDQLTRMQDELVALIGSWAEQGVPLEDGLEFATICAIDLLAQTPTHSFGRVVMAIAKRWSAAGGKL